MTTKIEIYGQTNCKFCDEAKRFCVKHNYAFTYRNIDDLNDRAEMFRRNPAAKTVPQIFIGSKLIGGCTELLALDTLTLQQMIGA